MIRKANEMDQHVRPHMRGGMGQAVLTTLLTAEEVTCNARMCTLITLQPGCSIGRHEHLHEDEIYYILSGSGTVEEGDGPVQLDAGDAVLTGNGQRHAIVNTGTQPLVLFAIVVTY